MRICSSVASATSKLFCSSWIHLLVQQDSRTRGGGSRREGMRQIRVPSGGKVMNVPVVKTWSQARSGVLENSLVLEISKIFYSTASWAFLLWFTHKKGTFGYSFPKHLQFRFRTTNWSKERGESQRVSDEPLQAPKYEEVYYTFTTCNNIELWTPQCVSAVLARRVPYDSTAEVKYSVFGRGCLWQTLVWQQCQVGWRSHQGKKGARAWE